MVRVSSAGWPAATEALLRGRNLALVGRTLQLVAAVILGTCVLGISTAWALTRVKLPAPRLWPVLAALPLAVPSYVAAFAWLATWPGINGFWPLAAIMILSCTPYVTLPVMAAFRLVDHRQDDVARTLGASRFTVLRRVTLPQIAPAAAAGALLAALYTISDFGAVSLMRYQAFTRAIHSSYTGSFNRTMAAVMALVLVALTLLIIWGERIVRGRSIRTRPAVNARAAEPISFGPATTGIVLGGLVLVAGLSLGLPVISLLRRLTESVSASFDGIRLLTGAATTLGLGLGGAALTLLLALPVAVLAARYRVRFASVIESICYLGHGLPGIVAGLSLVFFSLAVVPALYQTAVVLIFAYAVLFLPKAIGSARSAIDQVSPALEGVARTLGRSSAGAWWGVTARLAWPGIAASGLLVMVTAMKELPATLMLRPVGSNTLATDLWQWTSVAQYGQAAPYAIALIIVASVPAWLLSGSGQNGSR